MPEDKELIEAELRAVQATPAKDGGSRLVALRWWRERYAHKYPLYRYDAAKERIVRRAQNGS